MKRNNSCDSPNPKLNRLSKIFGVGLNGAGISIVILLLANFINQKMAGPTIISHSIFIKLAGVIFIIVGIALHLWAVRTLKNWWIKGKLRTAGLFKYFRYISVM